jgi:hypothetical protein
VTVGVKGVVKRLAAPRASANRLPAVPTVSRAPSDRTSQPVQYDLEADLVSDLRDKLDDVFHGSILGVSSEFDYTRGRTDLICVVNDGGVIAIEAKLIRWREALHQAYRNRCFAHRSYVALPAHTAWIAARSCQQFRDRGVGLLLVERGNVRCLIEPGPPSPVEPWLTTRARKAAFA